MSDWLFCMVPTVSAMFLCFFWMWLYLQCYKQLKKAQEQTDEAINQGKRALDGWERSIKTTNECLRLIKQLQGS